MVKLTLLATGGTISCLPDPSGQVVPTLDAARLLESAGDTPGVQVEAVDVERVSGWRITLPQMLTVARQVTAAHDSGADGVVVTHGTDTLEETAVFLDVACGEGTVVLTGAMRHAGEAGADGPANLADALAVAASPAAAGLGCLVAFGGAVHSAAEVRKVHSASVNAFASPRTGPVGEVAFIGGTRRVRMWGAPERRRALAVDNADARVPLIQVAAGMGPAMLEAVIAGGVDGVVIEGTGLGHVPADWVPLIAEATRSIPVVLASRTGAGPVAAVYGGPGGGHDLLRVGVIPAGHRTGRRARIELVCALGAGLSGDRLAEWISS